MGIGRGEGRHGKQISSSAYSVSTYSVVSPEKRTTPSKNPGSVCQHPLSDPRKNKQKTHPENFRQTLESELLAHMTVMPLTH